MKYRAQFRLAWRGTWTFDAVNDARAWKTAYEMIAEHTLSVVVKVAAIWELNDFGDAVRQLPSKEECERIADEALKLYRAWFINKNYTELYKAIDDVAAWNKARNIAKEKNEKIDWIEELDRQSGCHIRKLDSHSKCIKIRQAVPGYKKRTINKEGIKQFYKVPVAPIPNVGITTIMKKNERNSDT